MSCINKKKPSETVNAILDGDTGSISRLLTQIEHRDPDARSLLKALYPHTGKAHVIGVTGPGGVGKSTLINRLISGFRTQQQSVAVLAIDPSSPFSGGAILGDRLRMHEHFLAQNVFIRSLATQGMSGGISPALFESIHVLDAAGYDIVLIETIGVGQDEVQIARLVPCLLLVLAPAMGDEIQAMKAGLFEIGDILVVNKGDLAQSNAFFLKLQALEPERPIIKVSSYDGCGITELLNTLQNAIKTVKTNRAKQAALIAEELRLLLCERIENRIGTTSFSEHEIEAVLLRQQNPHALIETRLKTFS